MDTRNFLCLLSLMIFIILMSLQLDHYINVDYFVIFLPLWLLWKLYVFASTSIGLVTLSKQAQSHIKELQTVATLHNLILHILLTIFEFLVCYQLRTMRSEIPWTVIFLPLIVSSFQCIAYFFWGFKNKVPSANLDNFFSLNIFLFTFIPLHLDFNFFSNWEEVFVPIIVLLFVSMVKSCFTLLVCTSEIQYVDRNQMDIDNRKSIKLTICCIILTPIYFFQINLIEKLDRKDQTLSACRISIFILLSISAAMLQNFISNEPENMGAWSLTRLMEVFGIRGNILAASCSSVFCMSRKNRENDEDSPNEEIELSNMNENRDAQVVPQNVVFDAPD